MTSDKIVWLTDIHLNFLKTDERVQFYNRVIEANANQILITNDFLKMAKVQL